MKLKILACKLCAFFNTNKMKQPNKIPEYRTFKKMHTGNDQSQNILEMKRCPWWIRPGLFKCIYSKKKITVRAYKHCESFLILHKGSLVYEWYEKGFNKETQFEMFSMTKSVVATLLGIAIDDKYIQSIKQSVLDFFDEVRDEKSKQGLLIEHLSNMTSGIADGLEWRNKPDTGLAGLMMNQNSSPGEKFKYTSVNYHVLSCLIERAIKQDLLEYANERLFTPLDIKSVEWDRMSDGAVRGNGGISMTARDMLKLGNLWLNYGSHNGKKIVSHDYVISMTARIRTSHAFGQPFWNNSWFPFYLFGSYETRGHNGQFITVYPHMQMVIVRTGWPEKRTSINDKSSSLSGLSFYISRDFTDDKKNELKQKILNAKGSITKKYNRKTSFYISLGDSDSELFKVKNLQISIIDEEKLNSMLG